MLQILKESEGNLIATVASGKLTVADYDQLLPLLKTKLAQHQKIRWYFEMNAFEGWELKAFWEDVKFDLSHANDFEKVAMVGDKQWEEWMTKTMHPFTNAEIKYFPLSQKEVALQWIKS